MTNRSDKRLQKRLKKQATQREVNTLKNKAMRIAFGIPYTMSSPSTSIVPFGALMFMVGRASLDVPIPIEVENMPVDNARIHIVMEAIKHSADRILFIDSDMRYPPDVLHRLLAHDKPIVGCNYAKRDGSGVSVAIGLDDKPISPNNEGLIKVSGLGLGMALIKTSIFKYLDKPWFWTRRVTGQESNPDVMKQTVSEDLYFCMQAKKKGYDIYCDTDMSLEVGHSGINTHYLREEKE